MRLINADEMVKSLMDMTFYDEEGYTIDDYEDRLAIVKSFVDSVQTVDAEPVIRCIDCKWFGAWYCDLLHFGIVDLHKYCAWAERKGEKE